MKVFKKRICAVFVDSFVFGLIIASLQLLIPNITVDRSPIFYLLLLFPFFMRDFIFKGASIGKKLLGIRIYDKNWESPSFSVLLKRSFLTTFVGYFMCFKIKFVDGSIIDIIDLERDKLGTRVVDKKILKEIKKQVELLDGEYTENMSKLYDGYVLNLYLK